MVARVGLLSVPGMAMFATGAATALIAARILPPFLGQATGAAWAASGRDPFEGLIADHRHFVALLTEMEQSPEDARFHRTQLLLRLKRRLTGHALAEENIVYPTLHDDAKAADDAKHLYGEHADIKIHMHALEQMPKDHPDWVERVRALKQLLEGHARHEEEVDFPELRRVLDETAMRQLSAHVHREKAMVL
jgi:hemerythrin superfamily protein